MKKSLLQDQPSYTIRTSQSCRVESKRFAAAKRRAIWLMAFVAVVTVFSISLGTVYRIILCSAIPVICGLVAQLINLFGNCTGNRYIEEKTPIEFRLYDNYAVKSFSDGRQNISIEIPYEKIRRCNFLPVLDTLVFTGRFTKVSHEKQDTQHIRPKKELLSCVGLPVTPEMLSELANNFPVEICRFGKRSVVYERA